MLDPIEQVSRLLPHAYRAALTRLTEDERREATEIRLRQGRAATVVVGRGEYGLPLDNRELVTDQTIQYVMNCATEYSAYSVANYIAEGFLTVKGGHRIGICGTAVMDHGSIVTLKDISSLSIRIARPIQHIADALTARLNEMQASTLIIGPPGSGKTTFLRDTVRLLSDLYDQRVCVIDERCEIAAVRKGEPQLPVGRRTDVLSGCPKAKGIELCLRTMNPQWVAVDEITRPEDVEQISHASYCGVRLLATAHADSIEEFRARPVYRALLSLGYFRLAYLLDAQRRGSFIELE